MRTWIFLGAIILLTEAPSRQEALKTGVGGRGQGVSVLVPHRGGEARGQGPSEPPRSLQGPDGCCEEYLQAGGGEGKAEGWARGSHDPLAGSTHHAYCPTCPSVGGWVGGSLVILP